MIVMTQVSLMMTATHDVLVESWTVTRCISIYSAVCSLTQCWCHETTARAARLERGFPVTLIRLVSNVRVSREFRLGTLEDFATLPRMKGQTGCALDEAW
jgi:hypothetical protein